MSDLSPPDYEGQTFGYIFTAVTLTGAPLPTLIGYFPEIAGIQEGFLILAIGPVLTAGCIMLLYSNRIYRSAEPKPSPDTSD